MERSPSGHAVRAVLAVLATAALAAPVLVLHALPATDLDAILKMKGIKQLFDPKGILNPGKIW